MQGKIPNAPRIERNDNERENAGLRATGGAFSGVRRVFRFSCEQGISVHRRVHSHVSKHNTCQVNISRKHRKFSCCFRLRRMKEVGIIKRMEGNLTKPGNVKALQLGDGYNTVSAEHLILLFLILNVGAAASLIIFLLEIVNHSRRRDLREKHIHPHMRHDCTISLQDETFPFQSVTNFYRGNKQVPRRKSMVLFLD